MDKKRLLRIFILLFSIFLMLEGVGYFIGWKALRIEESAYEELKTRVPFRRLRSENSLLRKRIEALQPKDLYIVVDTASNILYLNEGRRTIRKVTISCGSGGILIDPSGKRKWIFETPKGKFTIQSKYANPTWIKPDWAFVEEGKMIPKNIMDRAEDGVLGEYALGFGNGYFIHGTLYTRLLGKNITHGCIRVGDEDLKTLYEAVQLCTKILIF
jgi:lipoprotein-anchoring transpeptidase ErfK/SrfK